jgi:hypothetical protein
MPEPEPEPEEEDIPEEAMQWAEGVLGVNQQPELPNLPPGWYYQDSSNPDDIIAINRNNHEQISGFCETHEQAAARAWEIHQEGQQPAELPDQQPIIDVDRELERQQQEKKKDEKQIKEIEERLGKLMSSYHDVQRCLYDLGWMTDRLHNRMTAHGYLMRRQGIAMSLTKDIARYTKDVTLEGSDG